MRVDLFEYIKVWCNRAHRHPSKGNITTQEFQIKNPAFEMPLNLKYGFYMQIHYIDL